MRGEEVGGREGAGERETKSLGDPAKFERLLGSRRKYKSCELPNEFLMSVL